MNGPFSERSACVAQDLDMVIQRSIQVLGHWFCDPWSRYECHEVNDENQK